MTDSNEVQIIDPGTNNLPAPAYGNFISPVIDIKAALSLYQAQKEFISQVLNKDTDFGSAGTTGKDSLYKPGAEKLNRFFGLFPKFTTVQQTEDFTGKDHDGEPFFYYRFECGLFRVRDGVFVGSAEGSANSWEVKYRYRWISADQAIAAGLPLNSLVTKPGRIFEFDFALNKAETSGKYGKPPEYWKAFQQAIKDHSATAVKKPTKRGEQSGWEIDSTMYRIPNPEICDLANTILKMAQKRSFIATTLIVCNASDYFTQDIEDFASMGGGQQEPAATHYNDDPGLAGNGAAEDFKVTPLDLARATKLGVRRLDELNFDELENLITNTKASERLRDAAKAVQDWIVSGQNPGTTDQPQIPF